MKNNVAQQLFCTMAWAWFFLRKSLYESKFCLYLFWSVMNHKPLMQSSKTLAIIMKKRIFLLLIFMFSFQVFSQKKLQKSEYIEKLEKHPFGSISDRYTLILTGYFDDCGEYGGHIETIELIRIEKKLNAIVTIFDKSCQDTNYEKAKILKTNTYLVDEKKIINFQEYLKKLLEKSLEYYTPFHAGKTYTATLAFKVDDEQNDDDYRFDKINIIYDDSGSTWTEFQKLKKIVEK
jgi:hypothetical protein